MPNLIKGSQVTKQVITKEVKTKQGDAKLDITLHLNLTITADGIQVSSSPLRAQKLDEEEDAIDWAVPDFGSEKINFGKQAE
jgi:hypothetical protein